MTKKIRIGVLFGGQSGEHEVSLVSAHAVMENLDREKYDVVPVGITKQGHWLAGDTAYATLQAAADPKLLPGGSQTESSSAESVSNVSSSTPESNDTLTQIEEQFLVRQPDLAIDVVFPVLHGPMGEDGTVQGMLELAGAAYVGCGVLASAVGMDKLMMKAAFAVAGLPLVPFLAVRRVDLGRNPEAVMSQIEAHLRYPMFVKPANMGSSVGITKATDRTTLEQGLREAARYDRRIVVEQGINAREIEVSVLGNDEIETSVPGEVVPSNEWYDYEAKYLDGKSEILIPAPIPPELAEHVQALAVQAFTAVDGAGLARVDFLLDKETNALYLNEVNTMPGFTPVSMYARMWEASGLSYPALLDRLITLALERRTGRQ